MVDMVVSPNRHLYQDTLQLQAMAALPQLTNKGHPQCRDLLPHRLLPMVPIQLYGLFSRPLIKMVRHYGLRNDPYRF
jgi:hypothetical protein